ncbi:response regulator transcription factor [Paraburkholderia caffeinilytica]|uniref:response regulator transcription factor n=1 Tax=Paraburkholderia caffeinilytica TaxID=1761016 RepID=UPI0038B75A7F
MGDKTVCVIDDELSVRQSTEALIRSMGLRARMYESAEDFLLRGIGEPCDCVVCDIRMGPMSGLALLAYLRRTGHLAPFIFVTAHAAPSVLMEAARKGALCVLEKPIDPEELASWLIRAIQAP